jgi:hypothetical protein
METRKIWENYHSRASRKAGGAMELPAIHKTEAFVPLASAEVS